jgi:hypothetical protein
MTNEKAAQRWFIDLDWLEQNNRSFLALAQGCLCPKCRGRLEGSEKQFSAPDLMTNIRDCCSKTPGFFTERLPVLESIFRLFLANGNQPLDSEELGRRLAERRGSAHQRTSVEVLSHLLGNDRYYGLRQFRGTMKG